MPPRPILIAHRGMPRRERENTLPSFRAALAAGADAIELDVHATSDGVVVVHHDPSTSDGLEIARTSSGTLAASAAARGTEVPTLESVCRLVTGRAELFVEIKGAAVDDAVLDVMRRYAGPYAIHGFDHEMIGRIARREPALRLGLLFDAPVPDVAGLLASSGARDAWPEHTLVDERLVRDAHAAGARVLAWTVNDAAEAARLTHAGVDGLCSDDITLLGEARG
ncbi:MAG TPA: glycerophosphodiester phosphodiesterase [Gemmatimonadaceae bacterium]|jgi:glycerophosphoryl diester phosphodiesterase|nr:glycerophosphodiester phosphodiesterase [Gemmatimonadaceae bacterium]